MTRLVVDPDRCRPADLAGAVDRLRAGGLVVFPTDTFYGLTADPTSARAIARLFEWKGRAGDAALPLVAADMEQVRAWFGPVDGTTLTLAERFWPGPLSLILPAGDRLAPAVHAGRGTVAVRVPRSRVARALAAAWGGPLPATSANRTGAPAVTEVGGLGAALHAAAVLVVDAGVTPGGAPSTIVDARVTPPRCLRDGAVPWDRVLESITDANTD